MEEKIAKGIQKLLKDFKENDHKDLEEYFDVDVTIFQHIEAILNNAQNGMSVMTRRMPYIEKQGCNADQNTISFYSQVDQWQSDVKLAVLLHDVSELPSYKDADGDEDPDEKPLFDVLAEYFGEGFKDYIPKDVLELVTNHHLDIDNKEEIEKYFSKHDKDFCLKFLYFLIVHDYGTLSLLNEFKTKKVYVDDDKVDFNHDLANIALNLKYNKMFNVIEETFYKEAKDDGKEFTTKIIAIAKIHNDEVAMKETTCSGDVGGGAHGAGDARHSNLFKNPMRRAWAIYKNRMKENDLEKRGKKKKKKATGRISNPVTFVTGLF